MVRRAFPEGQRHLNGRRGQTIFFQNRFLHDAPSQLDLWGGGSYIFTNVDPSLHATHGFEVPVTPGVRLHDLLTVELGAGILDHVVNDTGSAVTSAAIGVPSYLVNVP